MKQFDFVVVGSGIAGLTFALKAAQSGSVAVVTKRRGADSSTAWAQGGVACVTSDEDSFDLHIRDTLAGDRIWFHCAQSKEDLAEVRDFVGDNEILGIDTESTGINCYRPTWRLRTVRLETLQIATSYQRSSAEPSSG